MQRGRFFYLYLILDIWSRRIVGFVVHEEESMIASSALVRATCLAENVDPEGIVLHSDNGGPMKGSTMLATLQHLGIVASFSRPSVSDDNAYSESLFRTLKYRPEYPHKPFENLEAARAWVRPSWPGITPSIGTAASASSRRTSGMMVARTPSWRTVCASTSAHDVGIRTDGQAAPGTGRPPPAVFLNPKRNQDAVASELAGGNDS